MKNKLYNLLICLLLYTLTSAQEINDFYKDRLLVKVKPNFKENFKSEVKSNPILQSINELSEIKSLFNENTILLDKNHKSNLRLGEINNSNHEYVDLELYYSVIFNDNVVTDSVLKLVKKSGLFQHVEYCPIIKPQSIPNDDFADTSYTPNGYNLKLINAYKAWDLEKGNKDVTVGIIDVGFDVYHLDLFDNVKLNYADTIDGIDNDKNGYVDDFAGYDFGAKDNDPRTDDGTTRAHGTMVAGISSAVANNDTMMCGTGYNCTWSPLKMDIRGGLILSAGYEAILYAGMMGMKVVNLSWHHGTYYNQIYQDIINKAVFEYDLAVVAAAGNSFVNMSLYPASFDNVLSVAGTYGDSYWDNSTHSKDVDISAPVDFVTSINTNNVTFDAGTSFSAPAVSGALALVRSHFPDYTALQAMEQIRLSGVLLDTIPSYSDYKGLFGRRLDMYRALTETPSSLRMMKHKAHHNNSQILVSGDTISLDISILNVLKATNNCNLTLKCDSGFVNIIDSTETAGNFSMNQQKNLPNAFKFIVDNNGPKNAKIKIYIEIEADNYIDFQTLIIDSINLDYINLDTNNIKLTVLDNGRLAYSDLYQSEGIGLVYNNKSNILYEGGLMISTNGTQLSDCVRNEFNENNVDFTSTNFIKYTHSPFDADQTITTTYKDTNTNGVKMAVKQKVMAWNTTGNQDYFIVEYTLTNTANITTKNINAGLFLDWDITRQNTNNSADASYNRIIYDSTNKLGIAYCALTKGLYVGTNILTPQQPVFAALENSYVNSNFTNTVKSNLLNSGVSSLEAGNGSSSGSDISELIGVHIDSLKPNSSTTFAIGISISTNIFSIQNLAQKVLEKYKSIRTAQSPATILDTICKKTSLNIKPNHSETFRFYADANGTNFIIEDSIFSINNLLKDSTLYYSKTNNVFESKPSLIKVSVDNPNSIDFQIIKIDTGKVLLSISSTASKISWFINNDFKSNSNNYIVNFPENGEYQISLVTSTKKGCNDTLTKKFTAKNITLSVVNDIISDEIKLYPIPTKDILNVDIPDSYNSNIYCTITNLIGVEVADKKQLIPGIENNIDVSKLPNGIYFINIFHAGKTLKYKFVVN